MFHVVIPARYAATRLPGKPLLPISDRPLIQWVWESARNSGAASVIVATDDERILQAALKFGADCVLTSPRHASGTDRIAEVVQARGMPLGDIVVNLQGDEPMMPPGVISEIAAALDARPAVDIATAVAPIGSLQEFLDPSCVKALRGLDAEQSLECGVHERALERPDGRRLGQPVDGLILEESGAVGERPDLGW